jgi:glycosyltransferase involved in cell wall biosynthesis
MGWPWTEESPGLPQFVPDGLLWPRISIVTPSYNQGIFIEETIRSVILQGYPNLEYIIIDGCSIDDTVAIIKKYQDYLSYWVSERDDGQTYAIQKGMRFAKGNIVNWLNADDFLLPDALFKVAQAWHKNRTLSVFCGNAIYVNPDGKYLSSTNVHWSDSSWKLLPSSPPIDGGVQASWFVTKDLWDRVSGLNLTLNYTMDTDLYYRCFEKGAAFVPVDHDLAAYRVHQDTKTQQGWETSVDYKKHFYYSKCNQLAVHERKIYLPRIRRFLCARCLNSIAPTDGIILRLKKFLRAVKESPEYFLVPYHTKLALKKLAISQ